jgi:endonuclease-8
VPEGDSIWKLRAGLAPLLEGRRLVRADARHPERVRGLAGVTVERLESVGKHLLMHLSDATILRTHLGMKGQWRRYAPGERWGRPRDAMGVVLATETDELVLFHPKHVDRFRARDRPIHPILSSLGPDLLGPAFDSDAIVARARARDRGAPILAELLLDQGVAAGIGNIYKAEVLFLERRSPFARVESVDDAGIAALYAEARRLLKANLGPGPRNTTGRAEPRLWIYGASRRGCLVCRATPRALTHGDPIPRITWWCPRCQPEPGGAPPQSSSPR